MKNKQTKPILFSIIIPVFHETQTITSFLKKITQITQKTSCEIIIVDGSPTQDTNQKIKDKTITKLSSPPGRGIQLDTGAQHASGDILLFLHVDTIPSPHVFSHIQKTLQNTQYVGGASTLKIQSECVRYRFLEKCIALRTSITKVPYGDQMIFLKKKYYNDIGGFAHIPLMEDIEMMKRIKKHKDKIIILSESVFTSPRRWEQEGIIFCTLRNWWIRTLYYCGIHPNKLVRWYHEESKKPNST